MAISFPLSLPSAPAIRHVRITRRAVVAAAESPFTLDSQTQVHQGQRWRAEVALPPMTRAQAEPWLAKLAALNGREGTFLLGDPDAPTPQGVAKDTPGTPLVKGASQTGQDIDFDGAPNNSTDYLKAGDYVSLGSGASTRLHKVLEDASSDGSGNFTLTLWPKVVTAPADNAALTVANAQGVFKLVSNQDGWEADHASIYAVGFAAVSVV